MVMKMHTHTSASLREVLAKDDIEALGAALDRGLDPKTWLDSDSRDALLAVAVLEESPQCVELLLTRGGDWAVEAPFDEDQESPLGLAAEAGSETILKAFVDHGAVKKYSVDWLQDAIHRLVNRKNADASTLAFLKAVTARSEELTVLLREDSVARSLDKKIEQYLRTKPDSADAWATVADKLLRTVDRPEAILDEMEEFAAFGHVNRAIGCIEKLPPSWRREAAGRALVYAARTGRWSFADKLIEMGADCTFQFPDGATALKYAAGRGNLAIIRRLLDNGADLGARDSNGDTAIDMAGSPLVRRYLEKLAAQRKD